MSRHPVVEDTIVFSTKPMEECVEVFKDRMVSGDRGMMIHGPPKQGVSTVVRHICSTMRVANQAVILFAQSVRADDLPVNRQADSLWLQLIPANAIVTSYVTNRREVLARYIQVEAERLQTKHVLFAIDRAENLSLHQWDSLKSFLEAVRTQHLLSCFTLLAGQSELLSLPKRLNRRLRHNLVAEFFVARYRLRGVMLDELSGVLQYYDTTHFPLPDGPTYTAHFCPNLWKRGLRLASFSDVIREAFQRQFQTAGWGIKELGMEYVAATARRFLLGAEAIAAAGDPMALQSFAQTCVAQSGIGDRLRLLGDPEADALDRDLAPRKGWE
jgi:hypothetical protein